MSGTDHSRLPKAGLPKTRRINNHGSSGNSPRRPWQETFNLHSMDDASLKRMIDCIGASSAGRYRTCVVSIISKDSLGQATREKLVQDIIHQRHKPPRAATPTNEESDGSPVEPYYENQLLGHVDVHEGLVVLSLESYLETNKLMCLCEDATQDGPPGLIGSSSLLIKTWPGWNQNLLKTLLILFTLSNIVVFYNPEPSIDYSLIQLLKILEMQRNKSQSRICDLLATIASGQVFSQQWIRNARISCPRAIFVCDTSRLDIDIGDYHAVRNALEDQIAYLLKKAGLLQTLLSIPDNDDFVYIMTRRDLETKQEIQQLDLSIQSNAQDELTSLPLSEPSALVRRATHRHGRFRKFILKHVASIHSLANYSQDQDVKHAAGKQILRAHIIPRFDDFFEVLLRLKHLLFTREPLDEVPENSAPPKPDWSRPDERRFVDVYDSLNIDDLFSRHHCQKARVAAVEFYMRGLQVGQCDEQTHNDLVESARNFYINHARGPAKLSNLDLLVDSCLAYWQKNLEASKETAQLRDNSVRSSGGAKPQKGCSTNVAASTSMRPLAVTRKPNGSIKVASRCQCGHDTKLIIKPSDRRKRLERLDVYQVND